MFWSEGTGDTSVAPKTKGRPMSLKQGGLRGPGPQDGGLRTGGNYGEPALFNTEEKERPKAGREEALARSQQQVRNRAGLNLVLFTPFPPPPDKGSSKSSQAGGGLSSGWAGSGRKGALFLPTSCLVLEPSTMPSSSFLAISFLAQEAVEYLASLESVLTHGPLWAQLWRKVSRWAWVHRPRTGAPPSLWLLGFLSATQSLLIHVDPHSPRPDLALCGRLRLLASPLWNSVPPGHLSIPSLSLPCPTPSWAVLQLSTQGCGGQPRI